MYRNKINPKQFHKNIRTENKPKNSTVALRLMPTTTLQNLLMFQVYRV